MFKSLQNTFIATVTTVVASATFATPSFAETTETVTFKLEEATIADINRAFDAGALTSQQLVQLYLNRISAYEDSGTFLNAVTTIR